MKIEVEEWSINDLLSKKSDINDQPKYQRGQVWPPFKKQLLIDSILRGVDLPKLYLRVNEVGPFKYEVADGQQRLDAMHLFKSNKFPLSGREEAGVKLSKIESDDLQNLAYQDLVCKHKIYADIFDNYKVTVALIHGATEAQIRTLFGRLQLGSPLNQAEKRNSIISSIGIQIDNFVLNHKFFDTSSINESRFTRQDHLAHALALIYYSNKHDLKANIILELYNAGKHTFPDHYIKDTNTVLKWMKRINDNSTKKLKNKWAFTDMFWFLYQNLRNKQLKDIDEVGLGLAYSKFEKDRLLNHSNPKALLRTSPVSAYNQRMYDYVTAFKTEGARSGNLNTRNAAFQAEFKSHLIF
ncbi:Protein of unknown function DUF262 [Hymenobacter daecheongensis DSM 21074]|uniref:GmrSD restriction endonucleases N-terminal domain-containing protein n=1 Tax=Hymenobacter daecheongensis DSM 21074 TaxID=1121955 RepID=A0A1M6B437_9BACT|nr:DUF262 domain-containing protein [Hymenobacter daecheongensis]SHI43466.1 Protein of unknown function DUF262 [Hymenobacter daecheongensis DSM 21074]